MTTKLAQLRAQAAEIAAAIAVAEQEAALTAFSRIEEILKESGMTIDQLAEHFGFGSKTTKAKSQKVNIDATVRKPAEAKYQLPSGELWSGRGLLPRAFRAAIDANPSLTKDSFLIRK